MISKRKVLTWALVVLIVVSAVAVTMPYLARACCAELTGDPPLFQPSTPIVLMMTMQLNPNDTIDDMFTFTISSEVHYVNPLIVPMTVNYSNTIVLHYIPTTRTLTWVSGPNNYWIIVNVNNQSMSSPIPPIWAPGQWRPVWLWKPGDQITFTFDHPVQLEFYYKLKQ